MPRLGRVGIGPGLVGQSGGAAYSAEASAYFARLSAQPTGKSLIDAAIRALVASGDWAKLDALYLVAGVDASMAVVNMISSSYTATKHANAAFTAYRGIIGTVGASAYGIDSNFNPTSAAGKYAQDDASAFAWYDSIATSTSAIIGAGTPATGFDRLELYTQYPTTLLRYQLINYDSEKSLPVQDASGLLGIERANSTTWNLLQNGTLLSTRTFTSNGIPNTSIKFAGPNLPGHVMLAGFGKAIGAAGLGRIYAAFRPYLIYVGADTRTAATRLCPTSLSKFSGAFVASPFESTPIIFNGQMIVVTFTHGSVAEIRRYSDGTTLASLSSVGQTGTAIVSGSTLHLYAVPANGLSIKHFTVDTSWAKTNQADIWTVGDAVAIANLGITTHPTDGFVMSCERPTAGNVKFINNASSLTTPFSAFGGTFTPAGGYAGSPKLIVDGTNYYLTFLRRDASAIYFTIPAKSTDNCATWTEYVGANRLLYPDVEDGINASDMTLADDGAGNLVGVWIDGNQAGSGVVRKLIYTGETFHSLLSAFL